MKSKLKGQSDIAGKKDCKHHFIYSFETKTLSKCIDCGIKFFPQPSPLLPSVEEEKEYKCSPWCDHDKSKLKEECK